MTTFLKDKKLAFRLEKYITGHLDQPLEVAMLAAHFRVSTFTLQRICKIFFNQRVHQLVLEKRMETARVLVEETDIPIKQIIAATGFKSVSSFTHAFLARYGTTPGSLRNEG